MEDIVHRLSSWIITERLCKDIDCPRPYYLSVLLRSLIYIHFYTCDVLSKDFTVPTLYDAVWVLTWSLSIWSI